MKIGEQVSVTIASGRFAGKTLLLDVEEFQPYEPSAYAWTAGWYCAVEIREDTHWFFIDECGHVFYDGDDYPDCDCPKPFEECGICPAQEAEYGRYLDAEEQYFNGLERIDR